MSNPSISSLSSRSELDPAQLERIEQQQAAQAKSVENRSAAEAEAVESDRAEIRAASAAPTNVPGIPNGAEAASLVQAIKTSLEQDSASMPFLHSNLTANGLASILGQD